jgi:GNAT superfamily N-acetyltransferase
VSAISPSAVGTVIRYPSECECEAALVDGTLARIRPIRPEDAADLADFHDHLSGETVHLRFFGAHPHLRAEEVDRFTRVDYWDRLALIAIVDGRLAAVARYDREPRSDRAEVAFVVADARQGLGLGTLLLEHLAAAACRRGVASFVAETLGTNQPMQHLFAQTGFPCLQRWGDGVVDVSFPIRPTQPYLDAVTERDLVAVHAWLEPSIVEAAAGGRFVIAALTAGAKSSGRLGAACQSPAMAASVSAACRAQGLDVSAIVASADQSDDDVSDLLAYLAADEDTDVIAIQLDRVTRPGRLVARAWAAARRKPVVVLHAPALSAVWEQAGVETRDGVNALVIRAGQLLTERAAGVWRAPAAAPLIDRPGCDPPRARSYRDDPFVRQVLS